MTTEALKEEARKHEQNEEWIKALEFYLQAIEKQAEGTEPDIALHNRVGDLQVRMGDIEGAVDSYETAIQLYLDVELPNNAIAICRKIIRNAPTRPSPFLRMGQIRARQGFLVDARQNFVTYAEMMEGRGKTDEALKALEEFVGLAPKDVDTRLFLAEHLITKGRTDEAVRYLTEAYRASSEAGEAGKAEQILGRFREVAPDRPLPTLGAEPAAAAVVEDEDPRGLVGFESTSFTSFEVEKPAVSAPEPAIGGFGFSEIAFDAAAAAKEEEPEVDDEPLTGSIGLSGFEDGAGFQLEEPGQFDEPIEDETPLPMMDFGSAELGESEDAAFPLPMLEDLSASDEVPSFGEDLDPELGGDLAFLSGTETLSELDSTIEDEGSVDLEFVSGTELTSDFDFLAGTEPGADPLPFIEPEPEFASTASVDLGMEVESAPSVESASVDPLTELRRQVESDPGNVDGWQRFLEYAYQANDPALLSSAFLGLASALAAGGDVARSRTVYRQLLSVDPRNPDALAALGMGIERAPEAPASAAAPRDAARGSEEYVDLGALVLDDTSVGTTRWVVSATAPSGDENADFSRLLSQFKEQVSRNLSVDDAKAHYDLGTAYKEMGLVDEAIAEYQLSLRAEPGSLATFEMLGQCFLERGEPAAAIRTLERGLQLPAQVEDDLLGIYYFLAKSQEAVGNSGVAKDYYERIFALDINFKDVTERLRALR